MLKIILDYIHSIIYCINEYTDSIMILSEIFYTIKMGYAQKNVFLYKTHIYRPRFKALIHYLTLNILTVIRLIII